MTLLRIGIFFTLFFTSMGNAVCAADLNGIWKSDSETMIVYQDGTALKILCAVTYNPRPAILYGEGTVRDDLVSVRFRFSPPTLPSGWEERGTLTVIVSPDRDSLGGKWETESGSWSEPTTLKRARP